MVTSSSSKRKQASTSSASTNSSKKTRPRAGRPEGSVPDDRRLWVQCATCSKWRQLPPFVSAVSLPREWNCSMNEHDPTRNRCEDSEEDQNEANYESSDEEEDDDEKGAAATEAQPTRKYRPSDAAAADAARRAFCANLIKQAILQDSGAAAKGKGIIRRAKLDEKAGSKAGGRMIWVQCCSRACGKWRHIWKADNDSSLDGTKLWFCVQNTFDDRIASCGAPQETALDREFEVQLRPKLLYTTEEPDELPKDHVPVIASSAASATATTVTSRSMSLRASAAAAAAGGSSRS